MRVVDVQKVKSQKIVGIKTDKNINYLNLSELQLTKSLTIPFLYAIIWAEYL